MYLIYLLGALRVCNASGTITDEAVLVVAGTIPVDILTKEMNTSNHADRMSLRRVVGCTGSFHQYKGMH